MEETLIVEAMSTVSVLSVVMEKVTGLVQLQKWLIGFGPSPEVFVGDGRMESFRTRWVVFSLLPF
jgi:hypothetical protein